jgi:hypothetical protein
MDADERDDSSGADGRYTLDVFGLKLEVSNPRLAELLAMDAREALTTDVRELASPRTIRELRDEAAQAVPDVVMSPPTPKDEIDDEARREYRQRSAAIGDALGFDAGPDGLWRSPTGVVILTRAIERPVSLAAASHFVTELATRREQLAGPEASVLFVAESQQSADVFKVAIRQRHLYDHMRVVSMSNLEEVGTLMASDVLDHMKTVILLSPIADVDVGEILSVLHAGDAGTRDGAAAPGEIGDL